MTTTAVDAQQLSSVEATRASGDQQPCVVVRGAVPSHKVEVRRALRLMEALFLAGGLIEGVGDVVRVVHSSPEVRCAQIPAWDWKPDEKLAQSFSLAALQRDEETANPILMPGDIVDVERLPSVLIVGCVYDGRGLFIRKPTTVSQAIAMVGGVTRKAHKFAILKYNPTTPYFPTVIKGDIDLIRKGKAEDILLKDGDTVEVFRKRDMCGVYVDW